MNATLLATLLLFTANPSSGPVVSPQLLVGQWQSEQAGTYHFRADGTYSWRGADEG